MKQGDTVDTPNGIGKFFRLKEEDPKIALIRLKDPVDRTVWHPIALDQRFGVIHMIPINEVDVKDVTVVEAISEENNGRPVEDTQNIEKSGDTVEPTTRVETGTVN